VVCVDNFLTGKFYIVRGVWGAGIMGITMSFLDPDSSSVTPSHLSDLQHAVLYHTLTTNGGYRPPCELITLAASDDPREVRSRQGLSKLSNVTGERTVAVLPGLRYAVGSVSEDFEAVNCPSENCFAWCVPCTMLHQALALR
jgi:hypothetical protein